MSLFQQPVSGKTLEARGPVAERFYALYREQLNPDLTLPDSVVEEWIAVETFRAKEKIIASRNRSSIGRLPRKPAADHQGKDLTSKGPRNYWNELPYLKGLERTR
jgi:hypothetical protein